MSLLFIISVCPYSDMNPEVSIHTRSQRGNEGGQATIMGHCVRSANLGEKF